jgi:cell division GTPase FtsZ
MTNSQPYYIQIYGIKKIPELISQLEKLVEKGDSEVDTYLIIYDNELSEKVDNKTIYKTLNGTLLEVLNAINSLIRESSDRSKG